jgi:hypothetical protein
MKYLLLSLMLVLSPRAETLFNETRTAIFDSKVNPGNWTIGRVGKTEVGLRVRDMDTGLSENSEGVYHLIDTPLPRGKFFYEFYANSDTEDGADVLSIYDWYLVLDEDPSENFSPVVLRPFEYWSDNYFGRNDTSPGGGVKPPDVGDLLTFPDLYNVAQGSHYEVLGDYPAGSFPKRATFGAKLYATSSNAGEDAEKIVSVEIKIIVDVIDSDGDGILDEVDHCPNTSIGSKIDSDGCSVEDLVNQCRSTASSRREYMSCVTDLVTRLVSQGTLTRKQGGKIISQASRSR